MAKKTKKKVAKKRATTSDSPLVHEALERAFQSNVGKLYEVYLDAIVTGGDTDAAKDRFKRGLKICRKALADTKSLS